MGAEVSKRFSVLCKAVFASGCLALALIGCSGDGNESEDGQGAELNVPDAVVNDRRAECLLNKGFAVTRGDRGEVNFIDPEDLQFESYQEALRDCNRSLADEGLIQTFSPEDLQREYAIIAEVHKCLLDAGFPLLELPSEGVYVEGGGAGNFLDSTAPIEIEEAEAACPDGFEALGSL